jgi:hypothetical protein
VYPTNRQLAEPGKWHLDAAEGWLLLGNILEANDELEKIPAWLCAHPDVLRVRRRIYSAARKWDIAPEVANAVAKLVGLAYALHRAERTEEAQEVLLPIVDRFPDNYLIRYELACYACRLGELTEARDWLLRAFELPGGLDLRQRARHDPDLKPLWQQTTSL